MLAWHRERSTSRLTPPRKLLSSATMPPRMRTGMTDAATSSWLCIPYMRGHSHQHHCRSRLTEATQLMKTGAALRPHVWSHGHLRYGRCADVAVCGTFFRVCELLLAMVWELL